MGLITRAVAKGTLTDEVDALAEALAKSAVGALGRTKRLLFSGNTASLEEQLDAERDGIAEQGGTTESREGIAAFVNRRTPDFVAAATKA